MKKVIAVLPLLLVSGFMAAQAPFPTKNEISQFSTSTTCVVLEDDPFAPFNVFIKAAMKEFWTLTPFEFIDQEEFEVRMKKSDYSFIMLTETTFDKDKSGSAFNFINLVQGKYVNRISALPEICAIPLSSGGEDDLDYGYKLGAILLFMQKHAGLIMEDPSKTGRRYLKFYNENIPAVLSRRILVKKEDLSPAIDDPEKIKAIYSGKVEIVTEEDIVKAIGERTPGTVILHKVGPSGEAEGGYCFKMLIGTDDSNMYYYNSHTITKDDPDGLLPADLKRLARFD
ncbi:MAG TPA: hypothetical protein PK521_00495 [Bacteroidales bacterium]|jgi:hypothetical protein|nr:hypothetical protein [Bacteroidales bacterium]HQM67751.1 hypothetical protein [Bacteroidales bacterium]